MQSTHKDVSTSYETFSLENYFKFVGLENLSSAQPTLELANILIEHHLSKFIYRNANIFKAGKLDVHQREIPELDIHPLFSQMTKAHSGYCFQQNELFYAVLNNLGFNVDRCLAKVILQSSAPTNTYQRLETPKTHELLILHLNNKHYLIDVGMNDESLRQPLELREAIHTIDDDQYRVIREDERWILEKKQVDASKWFCLYHFFDKPLHLEDIKSAHKELYLSDKKIPIRDNILVTGITTSDKRKRLVWDDINHHGLFKSVKKNSDQKPKTKEFCSIEELEYFSAKKFGH